MWYDLIKGEKLIQITSVEKKVYFDGIVSLCFEHEG